jgi:Na+-transporting methylmalonyl-CoA/oxaloacetate decarboxylase gamma subunit
MRVINFTKHTNRNRMEVLFMDNWTFGITMLICGMGGTILTLWIMSLVMGLLGKLFPVKPEKKEA